MQEAFQVSPQIFGLALQPSALNVFDLPPNPTTLDGFNSLPTDCNFDPHDASRSFGPQSCQMSVKGGATGHMGLDTVSTAALRTGDNVPSLQSMAAPDPTLSQVLFGPQESTEGSTVGITNMPTASRGLRKSNLAGTTGNTEADLILEGNGDAQNTLRYDELPLAFQFPSDALFPQSAVNYSELPQAFPFPNDLSDSPGFVPDPTNC